MANIFFIGVGYKVFIFNNYLYLRLGFSRMLKIMIPNGVVVMTRKRNHLRIISSSHEQLESFLYLLKNLRVFDCYKGKGIFQNSDFSSVKLKVGKKQQFF
jgi:ribosomal protein L6P/L9E